MCGITGFLSATAPQGGYEVVTRRMAQAIEHRGPDGAGVWADTKSGIALGHRRLAVLDLSPSGDQPMSSAEGRYVLVFNGEIYNHLDIRAELTRIRAAPDWKGHSDTETLLAALEVWGVESTLKRVNGMFAFAIWDLQESQLWLARDRFGEKPLYYGWCGPDFVFGSELKALRAFPGFKNTVCRKALAQYLRVLYVPSPLSIYEATFKLEPGCLLCIDGLSPTSAPPQPLRAGQTHGTVSCKRWWSLSDVVVSGANSQITDPAQARKDVELSIRNAVKRQSLADVPLGAFLSGGVDSSLIAALMQAQSPRPIKTFTIGFEDSAYNEAPFAKSVATHLGTDHSEMVVSASEVRALIPSLSHMYDEPFGDSSGLPTHLVCKAARRDVTVALSGDAGDELFGGYNRYMWGPQIWNKIRHLPPVMRKGLAGSMTALSPEGWNRVVSGLGQVGFPVNNFTRLGEKLNKLGQRIGRVNSLDEFYLRLVSEWQDPAELVLNYDQNDQAMPAFLGDTAPEHLQDGVALMMYRDSLTYLPDDILCKVDRAAMACSLETRVPFLDIDVVETAWRLQMSDKIKGQQGKSILREILYDYVPRDLIERPKTGFSIPIGQWLRNELRDWAEALLDETRLRQEGYLNSILVRNVWAQHLQGSHDHTAKIWGILMFQDWLANERG